MKIDDNKVKELASKILKLCVHVEEDAYALLDKKFNYYAFDKYPMKLFDKKQIDYFNNGLKENLPDGISFFSAGLNKYTDGDFPKDKVNYYPIFDSYNKEKSITVDGYGEYKELVEWIKANEDISKIIIGEKSYITVDSEIRHLVISIVERFLFITGESCKDSIEESIKPYIEEALRYYLSDKLFVKLCIPVCLTTFEEDEIKLADGIQIVRMNEKFQMARQHSCKYEVVSEDWIAACATHMIILDSYCYESNTDFSFDQISKDYNSYPLQKIDEIIGIIRIVTGYTIGYEQLLMQPDGWIHGFYADLPAVYGAKSHFVNSKELSTFWMYLPVSTITKEQSNRICDLYKKLIACNGKLDFALRRYNRCVLREEIDDQVTDACIGLESLLSGDAKTEITYTISNRVPVVFSDIKEPWSQNSRKLLKKIYSLRSRIVHGSKIADKDKYCNIDDVKYYLPELAIKYLRQTIIFMLDHPKFLKSEEFDSYIDTVVAENKITE